MLLLIAATLLLTGCFSEKKIIYLQGADTAYAVPHQIGEAIELRIQPDDQLAIAVTSKDNELIQPFNNNTLLGSGTGSGVAGSSYTAQANVQSGVAYFHVDKDGDIQFPTFGTLHVGGKTTNEVSTLIQQLLRQGDATHAPSILDAIVTTKIMSFKVTILGDVKQPGTQTYTGERLTLLEAIGKAGDLNNTARREDVLVIREEDGHRITYSVNLRDEASVFQSPAYYLQQNDVIYVQPNKSVRVKGSTSYTWLSISSTLVGMLVSIVTLVVAITK